MPHQSRIVAPGPDERRVRTAEGELLVVPDEWQLLPPGDAALTRRVKAAGPTWTVQEKRGRKTFSRGVWASAASIAELTAQLKAERGTESYARRRASDQSRRERLQHAYTEDFCGAVLAFLGFPPTYAELAQQLAAAITAHATPVGSGTVARTQRIPLEQRAEAAVIAWLRHQTTAYDQMKIARVKGQRRAVRQQLAAQSRRLLDAYRRGAAVDPAQCPLRRALSQPSMHESIAHSPD